MSIHIAYGLCWLLFGFVHSALADNRVKHRLDRWFGRYYRLMYNLFATLHILICLGAGWYWYRDAAPIVLPAYVSWIQILLLMAGMVVLVYSLKQYDLGLFSGAKQVKDKTLADEKLQTGGVHRFVRHPLYSGLFLLLWGMASSAFGFATAIWGSLYLVLGTMSEERKLISQYGAEYERYRKTVPAFVPWKRPD